MSLLVSVVQERRNGTSQGKKEDKATGRWACDRYARTENISTTSQLVRGNVCSERTWTYEMDGLIVP